MKKRIKNGVLLIVSAFAFCLMFIAMAAVDGAQNAMIPGLVALGCCGWLALFGYANGGRRCRAGYINTKKE